MAKDVSEAHARATYHVKNLIINGVPRRVIGKPEVTLLTVLRDQLKMTGTKRGCNCGQCGVCNVILNGKVVRACITRWDKVPEFSEITTVEGLEVNGKLSPMQRAFLDNGSYQCGFCTPGMLMSSTAFIEELGGKIPTDMEIREGIEGNVCRCTGYNSIVRAIDAVAQGKYKEE